MEGLHFRRMLPSPAIEEAPVSDLPRAVALRVPFGRRAVGVKEFQGLKICGYETLLKMLNQY